MKTTFSGLKDLQKRVSELSKKVQKKINKDAVSAGGGVVLKAAKANITAVDTGSLKKSLGKKVKQMRKIDVAIAIVGPRTKFQKDRKTGKRKLTATGKRFAEGRWPTKYAHLVEKGTKARLTKTGKSTGQVKPQPFLAPAVVRSKIATLDKMAEVYRGGLM